MLGIPVVVYWYPISGPSSWPQATAVRIAVCYTAITQWWGSLADSTVITGDYIVHLALQAFAGQAIVIGHLDPCRSLPSAGNFAISSVPAELRSRVRSGLQLTRCRPG